MKTVFSLNGFHSYEVVIDHLPGQLEEAREAALKAIQGLPLFHPAISDYGDSDLEVVWDEEISDESVPSLSLEEIESGNTKVGTRVDVGVTLTFEDSIDSSKLQEIVENVKRALLAEVDSGGGIAPGDTYTTGIMVSCGGCSAHWFLGEE